MRTIAIINQKGGCGKTTTAINLAGVLARRGLPTLLIDLDPQSHCAAGLAVPENRIDLQIGDALLAADPRDLARERLVWRISRNLDLVPSTMHLAAVESPRGPLADADDRDQRLVRALASLHLGAGAPPGGRYRWCVIDCPPSIGLLAFNALRAADEVIIPVETGFFALRGAARQANTIRALAARLGREGSFRVLPTMHDGSSSLARAMLEEMTKAFGGRLIPAPVRLDTRLREAVSVGQPVVEYAPDSTGASDYQRVADWLTENPPHTPQDAAAAPVSIIEATPAPVADPEHAEAATACGDSVLTRAAELAARLRRLQFHSDGYQARLAADAELQASLRHANQRQDVIAPDGRSRFRLDGEPDAAVCVVGDFNGWSTSATPMRFNHASGFHEADVDIPPGRWSYRFVVDGRWITDPANPDLEENPFGEWNSVLTVRPPSPMVITLPASQPNARVG